MVDWNAQSVKLHKENLFQIPRWDGNDEDFTLYDLAAFLIGAFKYFWCFFVCNMMFCSYFRVGDTGCAYSVGILCAI